MNKATYKRAFNWGMVYSFRGRVRNHHGGEHDSRQAVWHSTGAVAQFTFYPQAAGRSLKAHPQRHTSSNKTTSNYSQSPTGDQAFRQETMGPFSFKPPQSSSDCSEVFLIHPWSCYQIII